MSCLYCSSVWYSCCNKQSTNVIDLVDHDEEKQTEGATMVCMML